MVIQKPFHKKQPLLESTIVEITYSVSEFLATTRFIGLNNKHLNGSR